MSYQFERSPQRRRNKEDEAAGFTVADLGFGTDWLITEAVFAISYGSIEPFGFEEVAKFYKERKALTKAGCFWLLTEAAVNDDPRQLRAEFPQAEREALGYMRELASGPTHDVRTIIQRVLFTTKYPLVLKESVIEEQCKRFIRRPEEFKRNGEVINLKRLQKE